MSSRQDVALPVLSGALGLALAIYAVNKWARRSETKKITGPRGWPIVGYMPYLAPAKLRANLNQIVEQYGPIFQLKLGSWNTVFLADYDLIRKAFHNSDFVNRPELFIFTFASRGSHGLLSSNGELWQEQRRFALRHLRDLGMGRSSIETHIQKEALEMIEILKKSVGQPFDFKNSLNIAITNIVWALVAGKRMAHDDPIFLGFMDAIRKNMETGFSMGIVGFMPWLKDLLPSSWLGLDLVKQRLSRVHGYIENIIKEHKATFDPNDLRDYTDYFIDEQRRQGEGSTFTDDQLVVSMAELFVAGGETTATTLRWAFLLLSWHPEIQKKLQDEIDSVVGRERLPTLEDREMMPYTEAVIHEVQRFADIIPMGIFHSANRKDVEFEGYTIPKDSIVTAYMGACLRDKKYWSKPDEFYPQHFLDESGKLKQNVEGFIPFSIGKRRCLGENLAKVELFYFITYFFQTFNFRLCQNDPKPSLEMDPKGGVVCWPSPYKVVLDLH